MRQHVFAFLVALVVWVGAHLVVTPFSALASGTSITCAEECYYYPVQVGLENHCQRDGQRCTGVCRKFVAWHGGCVPSENPMSRCREYYHPAIPDVYESYCVGSPPCDRNSHCGVIYNYRGKASETVTVRDCEVWLDISC